MSSMAFQLNNQDYDWLLTCVKASISHHVSELKASALVGYENQHQQRENIANVPSGRGRKGTNEVVARLWNVCFELPQIPEIGRADMERMIPPEETKKNHVADYSVKRFCLEQRLQRWNLKLVERENISLSDVYYSHWTMTTNCLKSMNEVARFVLFEEYPVRFKKENQMKAAMGRLLKPVGESLEVSSPLTTMPATQHAFPDMVGDGRSEAIDTGASAFPMDEEYRVNETAFELDAMIEEMVGGGEEVVVGNGDKQVTVCDENQNQNQSSNEIINGNTEKEEAVAMAAEEQVSAAENGADAVDTGDLYNISSPCETQNEDQMTWWSSVWDF